MTRIRARNLLTPQGWKRDIDVEISPEGRVAALNAAEGVADQTVDLLLPAPTNLHSHSFQRAMAGLTEARGPDPRDSFWTWRKLMYKFLQQLTPSQIEAIAAQVFMEMAEAGYACVAEFHYLHHGPDGRAYDNIAELAERIAGAAQEVGQGLTLLPVHYQFGGCDCRPLMGGQLRFGNDVDGYARLYEASRDVVAKGPEDWALGAAPHSLRAVDLTGLQQARALTGQGPFHMHLAEQVAEVDEVVSHLGARPVEWVLDNLPVDTASCFIHCTQMTADETRGLAQSGAVAGLCPITESSLGDGIFDGESYLGHDGTIGVGSDSNIQISLWEELKTLEYSQRLRDRGRAVLATSTQSAGRRMFESVLQGGAQAAGRASGTVAPGQWADLIAIDTDNEFLCNRQDDTALDTLIFSGASAGAFSGGGRGCITDVWSAGRHIVRQGRHIKRDQIATRFKEVLNALEQDI